MMITLITLLAIQYHVFGGLITPVGWSIMSYSIHGYRVQSREDYDGTELLTKV